jgi:hypothetical protein
MTGMLKRNVPAHMVYSIAMEKATWAWGHAPNSALVVRHGDDHVSFLCKRMSLGTRSLGLTCMQYHSKRQRTSRKRFSVLVFCPKREMRHSSPFTSRVHRENLALLIRMTCLPDSWQGTLTVLDSTERCLIALKGA